MAKFRFGLEKVLGYRKVIEDLAQRDYSEAQSHLNSEIQVLEELKAKKHEAFENRYQRQVQGGAQSEALSQVHDFLKGQDLRIKIQSKKVQDIEKQVEELRSVLREKAVDTKIMVGLKERKQDDFRTEQKKIEQKKLDDIATTQRRRKDAD
jgi:flagellar FliJ protein